MEREPHKPADQVDPAGPRLVTEEDPGDAPRTDGPGDAASSLHRIESLLREVRDGLDLLARERQHQEFSATRFVGAVLQAIVIGLVIAALASWVYSDTPSNTLIKAVMAGVFQLGALTAFVVSARR
jgi:hypothetical protein